jgi:hypothetical protein
MNAAVDELFALLADSNGHPVSGLEQLGVNGVLDYEPHNPSEIQSPHTVTIFREAVSNDYYTLAVRIYGSTKANPTDIQRSSWDVADAIDALVGSTSNVPLWVAEISQETAQHVLTATFEWPRDVSY